MSNLPKFDVLASHIKALNKAEDHATYAQYILEWLAEANKTFKKPADEIRSIKEFLHTANSALMGMLDVTAPGEFASVVRTEINNTIRTDH
jgi:hypothetical protein